MAVFLNDKVWRDIQEEIRKASKMAVKVGVLGSKGGRTRHISGISMLELAAIHEFGSENANIPERSFIRRTFKEKQNELETTITKLAKQLTTGKMSAQRTLELLGAWGAAEVKKTITSGRPIPPPLKPATVARKGSSRPLVDTGRLVGSIQWELER